MSEAKIRDELWSTINDLKMRVQYFIGRQSELEEENEKLKTGKELEVESGRITNVLGLRKENKSLKKENEELKSEASDWRKRFGKLPTLKGTPKMVEGLRFLADWFDALYEGGNVKHIQEDLRRWASEIVDLKGNNYFYKNEQAAQGVLIDSLKEENEELTEKRTLLGGIINKQGDTIMVLTKSNEEMKEILNSRSEEIEGLLQANGELKKVVSVLQADNGVLRKLSKSKVVLGEWAEKANDFISSEVEDRLKSVEDRVEALGDEVVGKHMY